MTALVFTGMTGKIYCSMGKHRTTACHSVTSRNDGRHVAGALVPAKAAPVLTRVLADDHCCMRSALQPLSGSPASLRASRPSSRGGSSCVAAALIRFAKAGWPSLRFARMTIRQGTRMCSSSCNQQCRHACLRHSSATAASSTPFLWPRWSAKAQHVQGVSPDFHFKTGCISSVHLQLTSKPSTWKGF